MSKQKPDSIQRFSVIKIEDFFARFTLIVGDINRGKTALTKRILETYYMERNGPISVVDLAPTLSQQDLIGKVGKKGVGGKLDVSSFPCVRYFHDQIHAPRLTAADDAEAEALARSNAQTIETLFKGVLKEKIDALFINDCSLYLHAGDPRQLLKWIRSTNTTVVNGYEGHSFVASPLSSREREGMAFLKEQCDQLIRL